MTKNLIKQMNKKLAPLRLEKDVVTHAIQLKLYERMGREHMCGDCYAKWS